MEHNPQKAKHSDGSDCSCDHKGGLHGHNDLAMQSASAIDPVCGMTVDPKTAKHKADHKGHSYYFCSAGCKTKFQANPEKYLDASAKSAEPMAAGTIYT